MANETQQLTVADLDAAKKTMDLISRNNSPYMKSPICDPEKFKSANIAATCIGIVEEMVKINGPSNNGNVKIVMSNAKNEDAIHIVALHNLWLEAVDVFGGEVK